ncbi:hypothetical protein HS088_TW13G00600 [Tripterygium wilfordii]|uniref:Uncharacterized protein n=1 Tax=Tripterygium wilfordii TaxID=458696 RepID=A0A7J7CUG1_TRIWF|nr:hypothetical protein HS088_TW13G00600 [Tripterygium wilfordii]
MIRNGAGPNKGKAWHMLHVNNASDYGVSLQLLRSSVVSVLPSSTELGTDVPVEGSATIRSPLLFWLGMPLLISGMLSTDEKREKMNDEVGMLITEC